MIPEHHSSETNPYDRGLGFGSSQRAAVENTIVAYERLFDALHGLAPVDLDAFGRRVGERLDATEPAALAEIRGIAAGAGVPADRLVAINARTEIFAGAGAPECSVIGISAERSRRGGLLAQNWDWHPDAAGSLVLWTVVDPAGRWFMTLTEAGILAKIGMNSEGLAVCINILASSDDRADINGVPIHIMLRLVLQRAGNAKDAEELLRSTKYSASTAITVAVDGEGADVLRTFEVSPHGVNIVPDEEGILTHTNHFRAPIGDAVDVALRDWPDTTRRLANIQRLANGAGPVDGDRIKAALCSHDGGPLSVCCHDPENPRYTERQETLASVVMHPRERYLELTQGPPCVGSYVQFHPDAQET